ncbi:hypothetical protein SAMN05421545_1177 [Pontibacter lucknowensis]|uniref:Uncharacterized protein n=1 Tax=Pontibacter lucknowensis TaxID=1077936 RepID=A0A1N6V155_9BACT|nr:hypothetical protein SAMN05421545_1177 [Pontibacter lucknowensis]
MSGEATRRKTGKGAEGLAECGRAAKFEAGKRIKSRMVGIPSCILRQHNRSLEGIDDGSALIGRPKQIFYRAVAVLFLNMRIFLIAWMRMLGVGMAVQAQQQLIRHHGAREQQQQKEGDICCETVHLKHGFKTKIGLFCQCCMYAQTHCLLSYARTITKNMPKQPKAIPETVSQSQFSAIMSQLSGEVFCGTGFESA